MRGVVGRGVKVCEERGECKNSNTDQESALL